MAALRARLCVAWCALLCRVGASDPPPDCMGNTTCPDVLDSRVIEGFYDFPKVQRVTSPCPISVQEYCGTAFPCILPRFMTRFNSSILRAGGINLRTLNPAIEDRVASLIYRGGINTLRLSEVVGYGLCAGASLEVALKQVPMVTEPCLWPPNDEPATRHMLPAYMARIKPCAYPCPHYAAVDAIRGDVHRVRRYLREHLYCVDPAVCAVFVPPSIVCLTHATAQYLAQKCDNSILLQKLIAAYNPNADFSTFYALATGSALPFVAAGWYVRNQLCLRPNDIPHVAHACAALVNDGAGCLDGLKLDAMLSSDPCAGYTQHVLKLYNAPFDASYVEGIRLPGGRMAEHLRGGLYCLAPPVAEPTRLPPHIRVTRQMRTSTRGV
ncbi:ORF66 [Ranid herpesvirus 1]|uniref:ORF66 n=1 Tax=Ranid herpesvirus 1 TaxID=85655 RepID=Q14VP2_9VIRU|nr:ORF66 [Ranid herpesvirus 1]ABG25744.1 ORF66 [Ranid herpesvirus 1]